LIRQFSNGWEFHTLPPSRNWERGYSELPAIGTSVITAQDEFSSRWKFRPEQFSDFVRHENFQVNNWHLVVNNGYLNLSTLLYSKNRSLKQFPRSFANKEGRTDAGRHLTKGPET